MKKHVFALSPATVEALLRNLDAVLEAVNFGDDAPAFVALQAALRQPLAGPASAVPVPTPEARTLYKQFEEAYRVWCRTTTGLAARLDGGQGLALKAIIGYLREHSREQTDAGALASWQYLLANWGHVPPFLQRQTALTAINKYLTEIMTAIRAAHQPRVRAWPGQWSQEFAAKLGAEELNQYRAHLRGLGWRFDGQRQRWVGPE